MYEKNKMEKIQMKVIFRSNHTIEKTSYWVDWEEIIYEFTLSDIDKCRETAERFCKDFSCLLDVQSDQSTDKLFYAHFSVTKRGKKK